MIPVNVVFEVDPALVPGLACEVPERGLWPFAHLPPEGLTVLGMCKITKHEAPKAAPKAAPKVRPGSSSHLYRYNVPEAPAPTDAAPLLPRAFVEHVLRSVAPEGPVEVADFDADTLARALGEYDRLKCKGVGDPGDNLPNDVRDAIRGHNLDVAVRLLALPHATAFKLLQPAFSDLNAERLHALIDETSASGWSPPAALRDELFASVDYERANVAREQAALEADLKRATEILEYDLAAEKLVRQDLQRRGRIGLGAYGEACEMPAVMYFVNPGYPILDGAEPIRGVTLTTSGTALMPATDRAGVGAMPSDLIDALRQDRMLDASNRSYGPEDFEVGLDPLTVQGRHALERFRADVDFYMRLAARAERGGPAVFAHDLWLTLVTAYAPEITVTQAISVTRSVLQTYGESLCYSRALTYDKAGHRVDDTIVRTQAWPIGLLMPTRVRDEILTALSRGSCWYWGEKAGRVPSPADALRIRQELAPDLLHAEVAKAVEGHTGVLKTDLVYAALAASGLFDKNPNPQQRAAVSRALVALGWETFSDKKHGRAWRRVRAQSEAPPAPVPLAQRNREESKRIHANLKIAAEAREARDQRVAKGLEILATTDLKSTIARLGDKAPQSLHAQLAFAQNQNAAVEAARVAEAAGPAEQQGAA